jgi:UrcA family protein
MKHLAICAAVLTLALPAAAQAGSTLDQTSVAVRVDDLNLNRSADARIALRRFERASAEACGLFRGSLREVRRVVERSGCQSKSMDRAVAALASPTVNALYRDHPTLLSSAE